MRKLKKYMGFMFVFCLVFNMISVQAFASKNDKLRVSARNAIAIEKEMHMK